MTGAEQVVRQLGRLDTALSQINAADVLAELSIEKRKETLATLDALAAKIASTHRRIIATIPTEEPAVAEQPTPAGSPVD